MRLITVIVIILIVWYFAAQSFYPYPHYPMNTYIPRRLTCRDLQNCPCVAGRCRCAQGACPCPRGSCLCAGCRM